MEGGPAGRQARGAGPELYRPGWGLAGPARALWRAGRSPAARGAQSVSLKPSTRAPGVVIEASIRPP